MKPDSEKEKLTNNIANCSDRELLERWKSGSEEAAELIVERYANRLIALIAVKMNRKFQQEVSPEDIVQSAMGSFFVAATESRIQISRSISLWGILATFAKRKMLRSIEKQSATKRGGNLQQVDLSDLIEQLPNKHSAEEAEGLIEAMTSSLPKELHPTFELAVAGFSQSEISTKLNVVSRTVRRRLEKIRQLLKPTLSIANENAAPLSSGSFKSKSLPNTQYSQFVLGRMIGSGGFGKVYKAAMQDETKQIVAVKFLRKAFWQDQHATEMMLREVDQASQIQHPSIVRYLGWGQSPQGGPYLVMQWIEGGTLEQCRNLSATKFAELLRNICQTIQHVHERGIIHGDLSPCNILIGPSGDHWITDFGFSQTSRVQLQQSRVFSDIRGGTLGFAAPEQISRAWGAICKATDVYAIGGLAYWYLKGHAPNSSSSTADSISQTLENSTSESEFPQQYFGAAALIEKVARRALVTNLNERPDSVQPLIEILSR